MSIKVIVVDGHLEPVFNNPQATTNQKIIPWAIFSLQVAARGFDANREPVETQSLKNVDDRTEITIGRIHLSQVIRTLVLDIEGFAPLTVQIN